RQAIYSKDGNTPLLSWRVAILPYLEESDLYRQFHLDEPWDSPHNKKLIAQMPKVYEPVGQGRKGEGLTDYQVFTGPETVFPGNKTMTLLSITDGTSNTLMVAEAKEPVTWTQPADINMPTMKDRVPPIGGLFRDGTNVVFCDGHVAFLRRDLPAAVLRALITPNGGEVVNFDY